MTILTFGKKPECHAGFCSGMNHHGQVPMVVCFSYMVQIFENMYAIKQGKLYVGKLFVIICKKIFARPEPRSQ